MEVQVVIDKCLVRTAILDDSFTGQLRINFHEGHPSKKIEKKEIIISAKDIN